MASPVVQSASEAQGSSATPTITEPASTASGDLLIAVVGSADAGTAITGLTGWTQLGEGDDGVGNRYWYGWIIRGASAPDLVAAAANANWVANCVRIDGHDATTPIGSDHGTATGTSTTPQAPAVDPGTSRDHLAVLGVVQEGKNDNRFTDTTPSGYTEQADIGSTGGGAGTGHIGGAMNSRAYTGQTETPGTHTSSRNDGWIAITMIVRPVAGIDYTESKAEAVGVTDSTPIKQGKVRAEAVGITDTVSRVHDAERVRTEPVGVTDLVTTAMTKVRTEAPYFSIPGTSGHYVSTPSTAAWNLSGTDITFEFDVQSPDWDHPGADNPRWLAKDNVSGNGRSWGFLTQGIELGFSAFDDSGALINTYNSTSLVLVDDERITVRVEVDIDNGSGGSDVHFYRNGVFVETVTFGTPLTGANAINPDGTTEVRIGARGDDADFFLGNFYRVRVWTDLTKTTLFADFDPSDFDIGDTDTDTAVGAGGFTWTINGADSVIGPIIRVTDATQVKQGKVRTEPVGISDSTPVKQGKGITEPVGVADDVARVHTVERGRTEPVGVTDAVTTAMVKVRTEAPYLRLPGASGHFASTPDHASLDITAAIELVARQSLPDWTPATRQALVSKSIDAGDERSYTLYINPDGTLRFEWSIDGTVGNLFALTSSVATGITDSRPHFVKVEWDDCVAATEAQATFYLGGSGGTPSWVQLGTVRGIGFCSNIHAGTAPLEVGAQNGGAAFQALGKFYQAQVFDGIGGTLVADYNADDFNPGDTDTDTGIDSTGKTWTINGAVSVIGPIIRVSDSVAVQITKQRSKAEPIGISDTVLPAQTHRVTITEAVGVADSTIRDLDSQRVVTEPVGVTDGTPVKQGKRISEAVGVADSTLDALSGDKVEVVIEPVGISDATQRQIDAVRSVVEPVGISDTVLPAKTIRVTITESVGVADATAPAKTARVVIPEAVGVADVVARQADWKQSVTEAVGVADVVTFVGGTSFVGVIGGLRTFTNLDRATVKVERTFEDKTR